MSKSLVNTVFAPQHVINKLGADYLALVVGIDC